MSPQNCPGRGSAPALLFQHADRQEKEDGDGAEIEEKVGDGKDAHVKGAVPAENGDPIKNVLDPGEVDEAVRIVHQEQKNIYAKSCDIGNELVLRQRGYEAADGDKDGAHRQQRDIVADDDGHIGGADGSDGR